MGSLTRCVVARTSSVSSPAEQHDEWAVIRNCLTIGPLDALVERDLTPTSEDHLRWTATSRRRGRPPLHHPEMRTVATIEQRAKSLRELVAACAAILALRDRIGIRRC
jgi:hypothetical protein